MLYIYRLKNKNMHMYSRILKSAIRYSKLIKLQICDE